MNYIGRQVGQTSAAELQGLRWVRADVGLISVFATGLKPCRLWAESGRGRWPSTPRINEIENFASAFIGVPFICTQATLGNSLDAQRQTHIHPNTMCIFSSIIRADYAVTTIFPMRGYIQAFSSAKERSSFCSTSHQPGRPNGRRVADYTRWTLQSIGVNILGSCPMLVEMRA